MNLLIVATIGLGLLVDQLWIPYGQMTMNLVTWGVLAALLLRSDRSRRPALIACLLIATAGECFLSLVWGLYTYRLENIPLFVPPGHVLMFYLGLQLCERMPPRGEWLVVALAAPVVAGFAWTGKDTLGPILYAIFLACMFFSPSKRLYGTMFVISLVLEIYGTWLGNWFWSAEVPWLGLTTYNPPLAAGTFYCVLDLLVLSVTGYPAKPILNPSVASHQAAT